MQSPPVAAGARPVILAAALIFAVALGGCAPAGGLSWRPRGYAFPVSPGVTFDLTEGREISAERLAEKLAATRLLFLGEHHTDPRSRDFQLEVLRLLGTRGRRITLALEMLPPSADGALEAWRLGLSDEAAFLDRADWYGSWGFPWSGYRELFLFARRHRIPLRGINAEKATRTAVRKGDLSGLAEPVRSEIGDLTEETRPHSLHLLDVLRATGHGEELEPDSERFRAYRRVQWMWDRLMGARAARLAEKIEKRGIVVVIIGSGHLAFKVGAPLQAARAGAGGQLVIWDQVLSQPPAGGKYPVPVGMADLARVYPPLEKEPGSPRLRGVALEKAEVAGETAVRVKTAPPKPPPGQPALAPGDLIQKIAATAVNTPAALRWAVEKLAFGQAVPMEVVRGGKTLTLSFRPEPAPEP